MLLCMRTTVEIGDALLSRLKGVVKERNTTMRDVIEKALQAWLDAAESAPPFELEDLSCGTGGPRKGVNLEDWDQMRELIYEDESK